MTPEKPHLKAIPPLETDGIGVAKAGIAAWAVVMVAAWIMRPQLPAGLTELPQISTAGFLLGLIGLAHLRRRVRRLARRQTPQD